MRGRERRRRRRVTGRRSFLAVRESGDQKAEELANDGPVTRRLGRRAGAFRGRPPGWLEPQ